MTIIVTILLGAVGSVLAAEILDFSPWLTRRLLRRAATKLPVTYRERYVEEWLAEADFMRQNVGKLTILLWALGVYATSGRLARECTDMPPQKNTSSSTTTRGWRPETGRRFQWNPFSGTDDIDIPTVIRNLTEDDSLPPEPLANASDTRVDLRLKTSRGVFVAEFKYLRRPPER